MTLPPQINATLTSIEAPGATEDYDRPAGSPVPRWSGESGVFIDERLVSGFNASGELNRTMQTTMYFDNELAAVELGDTMVYQYRGENFTARVANLTIPILPGAPSYGQAVLEVAGAR